MTIKVHSTMVIDTHTHLDLEEFDDTDEVIIRARSAGVNRFILPGTTAANLRKAVKIAEIPGIWYLVGIHPEDADGYKEHFDYLTKMAEHPKCAGIGEIGLDYYHSDIPKSVQKDCFEKFLKIASDLFLPVVIHTRNAAADTLEILSNYKDSLTIIFHCFTGDKKIFEFGVKNGSYFSIGGIVTYPKAGNLQNMVSEIPINRLIFETDAPYLAPVPYRGRRNEPAFIVETIRYVSKLLDIDYSCLVEISTNNAFNAFKISVVCK
ncbi:MAG: hydrolase TatD [bacterium]|nr:MAG: hydrolase TatD [bacterium]